MEVRDNFCACLATLLAIGHCPFGTIKVAPAHSAWPDRCIDCPQVHCVRRSLVSKSTKREPYAWQLRHVLVYLQ